MSQLFSLQLPTGLTTITQTLSTSNLNPTPIKSSGVGTLIINSNVNSYMYLSDMFEGQFISIINNGTQNVNIGYQYFTQGTTTIWAPDGTLSYYTISPQNSIMLVFSNTQSGGVFYSV